MGRGVYMRRPRPGAGYRRGTHCRFTGRRQEFQPRRGTGRLLSVILLFVILGTPLFGQEEGVTPAPYSPDEFPGWAKDLRRGEVIALGVFPVALILTQLTYDLARFGVESVQAGEVDREAAPWFFAPPGVQRFSQQEKETILITSAVVSVVFAVVDYALGRRERRRSEQP